MSRHCEERSDEAISLRQTQLHMKARILTGDPADERLCVYSGGYVARMREALEEAYPAVRHVTGARTFSELARSYAARHPSHDYNLSLAGRHLPEFLQTYSLTKELPFLPDLARLEWQVVEAFHAFDQPPLDPSRLSAVPPEDWERLRLIFQPSVHLLASAWPVLDIWEARDRPIGEVRIDLINRPQRILIFRSTLEVRCELLDQPQDAALEALLSGKTLGELPDLVPEWFSRWSASGLIVNINLV